MEHWCLALARAVGLPAARSRVAYFGDEVAMVVERYDRVTIGGVPTRIHQEDCCQALAVAPTRKYESDGGPGVADVVALLRARSDDPNVDIARFVDAVAFDWLIGGTDAHAKNYSLLHARGPRTRLAPLYDVISVLPYPDLARGGAKLAMAVGGERNIEVIDGRHWRAEAKANTLDPDIILERVVALGQRLLTALPHIEATTLARGAATEVRERFDALIDAHARACLTRL